MVQDLSERLRNQKLKLMSSFDLCIDMNETLGYLKKDLVLLKKELLLEEGYNKLLVGVLKDITNGKSKYDLKDDTGLSLEWCEHILELADGKRVQ